MEIKELAQGILNITSVTLKDIDDMKMNVGFIIIKKLYEDECYMTLMVYARTLIDWTKFTTQELQFIKKSPLTAKVDKMIDSKRESGRSRLVIAKEVAEELFNEKTNIMPSIGL